MVTDGDPSHDASQRAQTPPGAGPGEVSVQEARTGVVARLRARQDELVREIFARVRAGALAGPGDEGAEYVEGLRATVVAAVEYVLEGIE